MTDNEIAYQIYLWDRSGYNFYTEPYNPERDYTHYLSYYTDKGKNQELRERAISGALALDSLA